MKEKHNGLVDKFNKNVADYNRLIGENRGLEERFNDLQQRHNRLERDNRELREKYENERNSLQQRVLQLTRDETRVREEGVGLRNQLIEVKNEKEVLLIRVEEKNTETLALTNQMSELTIAFDREQILD